MAIMCPDTPRETKDNGAEELIFHTLEKGLPNDYYVFHGMHILNADNGMEEHETDFVIFHKDKGILVLEVKSGAVYYEGGKWHYATREMKHGGPFVQAITARSTLLRWLKKHGGSHLTGRCKFLHGAWFPDVTWEDLRKGGHLPPEADKRILLTEEDLDAPQAAIDRLLDMTCTIRTPDGPKDIITELAPADAVRLLDLLAPSFHAAPLFTIKQRQRERVFKELAREQVRLLNYLEEQPTAVINGRAGTGKTVMAVTKARRHAAAGERVLFLTFNKYLCARLREDNSDLREDNSDKRDIEFYNIDRLAAKYGGEGADKYTKLLAWMEQAMKEGTLPWQHVIVDEGQDFGRPGKGKEAGILDVVNALWLAALDEKQPAVKTFYAFYDKCQLVQGNQLPDFIEEADCKLTLYMNCRNTKQIAGTSELFLRNGMQKDPHFRPGKVYERAAEGDTPEMYFVDGEAETAEAVDCLLKTMRERGYTDIVILTCRSEKMTRLKGRLKLDSDARWNEYSYWYPYGRDEFPVTTCRKFKGLEADAVILVDLERDSFEKRTKEEEWDHALLPYVGATRAKFDLGVVANLTDEECNELLQANGLSKKPHPKKALAITLFHALYRTLEKTGPEA